jgi:predicted dehydrogenase
MLPEKDVQFVAVCDAKRSQREAVKRMIDNHNANTDCKTYRDMREFLASRTDIDGLLIATGDRWHALASILAMRSGKDVYSAVPIISIPDGQEILDWCDRLVKTVQKTGRHYMLGETTFYRPEAMYCRRRAAEGAFGDFVHSDGEYLHDVDSPQCNLRVVQKHRLASKAGQEWLEVQKKYKDQDAEGGPMHYPTHSTSGPMSVMNAHAVKVSCWGYDTRSGDAAFGSPSNETTLFHMSNGSTMRIREYREIGMPCTETFRVYGTQAAFEDFFWVDKHRRYPLKEQEMRDPLPEEVEKAWRGIPRDSEAYGGHGGSHPYLVHEFVSAVAAQRVPAINIYEAVRYMAAGVVAHQSAQKDGEVLKVPDWGDAPAK